MTTPEPYAAVADQLRSATETATQLWQQGAGALAAQAESLSKLPALDPTAGLQQYFDLLTKAAEANRELAAQWSAAVTAMSGALAGQLAAFTTAQEQAAAMFTASTETADGAPTEPTSKPASKATPKPASKPASPVPPKPATPPTAEETQEHARAPYTGLTKASLVSLLTERKLPKSGTVEQLVSRLVADDLNR